MRYLAFFVLWLAGLSAWAGESVVLQLKWQHAYQFAGYYVARELGYYREAGLEVELREGGPQVDFVAEVVSGRAHYATGSAGLVLDRNQGKPVVVLAVVFQHSPDVLIASGNAGITSPQQLVGQRVMTSQSTPSIASMLLNETGALDKFTLLEQTNDLQGLIDGRLDAIAGYLTDQPFFFGERGFPVSLLRPIHYGVDFYGDNLFTSEQELKAHPKRVKAFRAASLRGWEYAMAHPDETIAIVQKYGSTRSVEHLRFEYRAMGELILAEFIALGHMHEGRWKHIAAKYVELGQLDPDYSLDGFLYDPNPSVELRRVQQYIFAVLGVILAAGVAILVLARFNGRLRREIVERQHAESLLKQSDLRFRTLFESSPDPVWIIDNRRFVQCNRAAVSLLGYSKKEEFLNSHPSQLSPSHQPDGEDSFSKAERMMAIALEKGINRFEWIHTRADGSHFPAEVTLSSIELQGSPVIYCSWRDISGRKETERNLAEQHALLQTILERLPVRVFWKDRDSRYLGCNTPFALDGGVAGPAEVVGKDDYQFAWREQADLYRADDRLVMDSGQPKLAFEEPQTTPDGRRIWLRTSKVPLLGARGETIGVLGLYENISEQKKMERRERTLRDALETIAQGLPLQEKLHRLVSALEDEIPGSLASILLLDKDGRHLRKSVAPNLPDFYNQAIDGVEIGPGVGSCGTAAYENQRVVVADIPQHPYWAPYTELAARAGVASCWSDPVRDSQGKVLGTFAIYHRQACSPTEADLHFMSQMAHMAGIAIERHRAEETLRRNQDELQRAQAVARIGSWLFDIPSQRYSISAQTAQIFGFAEGEEVTQERIVARIHPDDRERMLKAQESTTTRGVPYNVEFRIFVDGEEKWVHSQAEPNFDAAGKAISATGTVQEITSRKRAEARIEFLAHHDPLTELPNRLLAREHFDLAVAFAERAHSKAALLFLDLDNFKTINDTLGHAVGDELLKEIARRLRECVRDTDTISRQGGDEFLIVLSDVRHDDSITVVTEKILAQMACPFILDVHELTASFSVGIAVYPDDGQDFANLLRMADTAMYHAKSLGRNTYSFFTEQMNLNAAEHLRLHNQLAQGLAKGEFFLHYQPQIELDSGRVSGAEALLRWSNPQLGPVSPGRFIPVAEDTGLIVAIGEWVLAEVCRQAAAWRAAGLPDLVLAVNLSAVQFRRGDLVAAVARALAESGLPAALLELELTESILIQDTDKVLDIVQRLRSLGVKLSLDDFGTGYSSMAYLKRFNVDRLKIDQSFIRDIATDPGDAAMVRAIIQMARGLNVKTVAEGVEDERQAEFLRQERCDEVQGYHFARPMPGDAFTRYLAERMEAGRRKGAVL